MTSWQQISRDGLWKNNAALVQVLGLCPLLAVTNSVVNGLGLGIATTLVLIGSNVSVSIIRKHIPREIRIPIFVMLIASFVTIVQLLMNAYTYELYLVLGIFIPLIVTNCVIIGRAEAFASRNSVGLAFLDGVMQGMGFLAVLVVLGGMREILGQGTLFDGAELLLGDWASNFKLVIFEVERSFLFAVLPPGAFVGLGLLIALKNYLDQKVKAREQAKAYRNIPTTT